MLFINQDSHIQLLTRELKQLLPDGSFASRMRQTLGQELHDLLMADWPYEVETECSSLFPVETLFAWATEDGGFNPEWLASDDGSYLDDDGEVIQPPSVKPSYSAVEQLAAYGLWLLDAQMESLGPIPENDVDTGALPERNCNGFMRDEVIEHRAACMLLAYQSLSYCQRILGGTRLTSDEEAKAKTFSFSEMGKAGAKKRHAAMTALRSWAIEKYQAGEWQSANQAAHSLKESIISHGRTINVYLSEANAQRTIAEWFRKSA